MKLFYPLIYIYLIFTNDSVRKGRYIYLKKTFNQVDKESLIYNFLGIFVICFFSYLFLFYADNLIDILADSLIPLQEENSNNDFSVIDDTDVFTVFANFFDGAFGKMFFIFFQFWMIYFIYRFYIRNTY